MRVDVKGTVLKCFEFVNCELQYMQSFHVHCFIGFEVIVGEGTSGCIIWTFTHTHTLCTSVS